ncbi:Cys-tRNA(Pro)/Cys-tRNA(Cys) deacylase [Rhodobacter aestuarii]|uniref:Cys-tRNA(Pro)/Cys-tRNA(Cys) deacylase n=1 Tax=Rhodobacter aestuarii TaxID=453582 RepID=A0A1N7L520_9RHOB|nr:Cys-tRNA(Pro) deacylase [Rhodobacter aestuarii]PTV95384.1 Cys-tRNA(Pro)/Cys-tRNA(Cys) deacylase [Rhodobacter aestuarii]SIS68780.1 Cys-tRNA(Pro)/Cys-tRNA(Cys) deacylase [Rhodobacter aestuarii]
MSTATPATRVLEAAKIPFERLEYDYVAGQDKIGLHAAQAIGADPAQVLKTLMVEVDGRPACAVIPSDAQLSMKKVAAAFGGKAAVMMAPDKAERLTGFHTGGISPFGQKKRVPVAFEESALGAALVVINGGKRGLMVRLAPEDALKASSGGAKALIATG